MKNRSLLAILMLMGSASVAVAQDAALEAEGNADATTKEPGEARLDTNPTVPGMGDMPSTGMLEQAGTGGEIAFADAGVIELGGGGNMELSSAGTFIGLRPFIGWFIMNNIELTGIAEVAFVDPDVGPSSTTLGLFVEPSFHMPFNNRVLGFVGLGLGFQYDSVADAGLALRPRLGVDILVGRSGIFRPALEMTWSTTDVVSRSGQTLVGVSTSFGVGFSYSVML
jgi:hypothetical protein